MKGLEDEEPQINGVVHIYYCVGMAEAHHSFSELLMQGSNMIKELPFRMTGFHFCYSDYRLRPALSLVQMVIGQQMRLRFRTHFGESCYYYVWRKYRRMFRYHRILTTLTDLYNIILQVPTWKLYMTS
jgi:hypothetical protein